MSWQPHFQVNVSLSDGLARWLLQAVDKRKELAKRCAALEAEAQTQAGLQGEVQRLEQRCQQLQVSLSRS